MFNYLIYPKKLQAPPRKWIGFQSQSDLSSFSFPSQSLVNFSAKICQTIFPNFFFAENLLLVKFNCTTHDNIFIFKLLDCQMTVYVDKLFS